MRSKCVHYLLLDDACVLSFSNRYIACIVDSTLVCCMLHMGLDKEAEGKS